MPGKIQMDDLVDMLYEELHTRKSINKNAGSKSSNVNVVASNVRHNYGSIGAFNMYSPPRTEKEKYYMRLHQKSEERFMHSKKKQKRKMRKMKISQKVNDATLQISQKFNDATMLMKSIKRQISFQSDDSSDDSASS